MPVLGNMSNSLWKQYLSSVNGFPSDTFMYSKDGNIGIHKTLLVAASPFIKSLLLGLHEPCIILPDVSYKCLTHFKSLLYHAKVGFASLEELQNLSSLLKLLAVPVQNIALDCPGNVTVLQDKVDLNVDSLVKQVEILQKQMEFADSDIESDDFLVDECDAEVSKIFADDDKIEINTDDRDPLQLESDSAILSGVVKTEIMTVDIVDTLNVLPGPSYTLLRPCRNKRKVASVETTSSAKKQLRKRQSQHRQEVAMVLGFHPDEATMDLDPSLQDVSPIHNNDTKRKRGRPKKIKPRISVTEKKQFYCHMCPEKYTLKASLLQHISSFHEGIKLHLCEVCSKSFTRTESLKTHLSQAHNIGTRSFTVKCPECSKEIFAKKLQQHRRTHTGERPFSCNHCNKHFTQRPLLKRHLASIHNIGNKEERSQCTVCWLNVLKRHLNEHMKIHSGKKPFDCEICSKSFISKWKLKRHETIHYRDKPGLPRERSAKFSVESTR